MGIIHIITFQTREVITISKFSTQITKGNSSSKYDTFDCTTTPSGLTTVIAYKPRKRIFLLFSLI